MRVHTTNETVENFKWANFVWNSVTCGSTSLSKIKFAKSPRSSDPPSGLKLLRAIPFRARRWSITDQSQPNPTIRPDGPFCMGCLLYVELIISTDCHLSLRTSHTPLVTPGYVLRSNRYIVTRVTSVEWDVCFTCNSLFQHIATSLGTITHESKCTAEPWLGGEF